MCRFRFGNYCVRVVEFSFFFLFLVIVCVGWRRSLGQSSLTSIRRDAAGTIYRHQGHEDVLHTAEGLEREIKSVMGSARISRIDALGGSTKSKEDAARSLHASCSPSDQFSNMCSTRRCQAFSYSTSCWRFICCDRLRISRGWRRKKKYTSGNDYFI